MKETMYDQLGQMNYKLKMEKRTLRNKINECNAKIEIIEQVMFDIESILTDKGEHIFEHYEEATDEKDNIN